jgi:hypothetical protein
MHIRTVMILIHSKKWYTKFLSSQTVNAWEYSGYVPSQLVIFSSWAVSGGEVWAVMFCLSVYFELCCWLSNVRRRREWPWRCCCSSSATFCKLLRSRVDWRHEPCKWLWAQIAVVYEVECISCKDVLWSLAVWHISGHHGAFDSNSGLMSFCLMSVKW